MTNHPALLMLLSVCLLIATVGTSAFVPLLVGGVLVAGPLARVSTRH